MSKVYPIFTAESHKAAGGVEKAKYIITKTIMEVAGMTHAEFDHYCVFEVTHNQVCLLVKDIEVAKRIRNWKRLVSNILRGHKNNRQLSGYMFHSAHQSRTI